MPFVNNKENPSAIGDPPTHIHCTQCGNSCCGTDNANFQKMCKAGKGNTPYCDNSTNPPTCIAATKPQPHGLIICDGPCSAPSPSSLPPVLYQCVPKNDGKNDGICQPCVAESCKGTPSQLRKNAKKYKSVRVSLILSQRPVVRHRVKILHLLY